MCPFRTAVHVLSERRLRRTVWSPLPEASKAPSGVQARAVTQWACPFRTPVLMILPACRGKKIDRCHADDNAHRSLGTQQAEFTRGTGD